MNYSRSSHCDLELFWELYWALLRHRWIHCQGCRECDSSLSWLYALHSGHLAHRKHVFERFWSQPCLKSVCIDQVSCKQSPCQWCLDSLARIVEPIDLEKPISYPFSRPFLMVILFTDQTLYLDPCPNLQFQNMMVVNLPWFIELCSIFDFFDSHSASTIFMAFFNSSLNF